MAKATARELPPVKPVVEYTLVMNQAEAEIVASALGRISGGGTPDKYRGAVDNVYNALSNAGAKSQCLFEQTLYFKDRPT